MTTVTLTNLEKCYPNGHQAISKLNLSIEQGEMVVLVGLVVVVNRLYCE